MAEQNTSNQSFVGGQPQPSVPVAPANLSPNDPAPSAPNAPAPPLNQPPVTPNEPTSPVVVLTEQPMPAAQVPEAESPWQAASTAQPVPTVNWTASEYIAHHKSPGWYVAFGLVALIGAFLLWLFTKDLISPGVVLFGAIILGVYGGRQPRQQQFQLDQSGLTIGTKYYPYDDFRSFSVIAEGAFSSIMFMPLKRFAAPVSIYYAPQDEAAIIALLGDRLPSEEHSHDPIDRLMDRIRF